MTALSRHLAPTRVIDFDEPSVADFAQRRAGSGTERERAVRLYYAVRDGIRYDPYAFRMEIDDFKASQVLRSRSTWCVPKAILLAAACRQQGIPARLGFADVRNHLATERLLALMDTDLFVWHGYVSILLEGKWVKATPAFNIEMCQRFEVLPLEFDGTADSLMHPFNARNQRHMEYVQDRGTFDDLPHAELVADMRRVYSRLIALAESRALEGRFDTDSIRRET